LPDPEADVQLSDPLPWADLRTLAGVLDQPSLSLAVHAIALGGWHRQHPHCSVCGHLTEIVESGASRRCSACGALHFPRTDPAVIMLVVDDDDRALLGHNSARATTWYSTLAGFVEPGESPEEAVAREVLEEAGIEVTDVTYAGSQPWPFPSSLMLGFFARATSVDIHVDGDEITEARWFSRETLTEEIRSGNLVVPTTISIAGSLLSHWYGGPLPQPGE
jgi:NAD+ diphosphatase